MRLRITDSAAKNAFLADGVSLQTEIFNSNGFKLHYAKTGNDTFPTLFFVHGSPGSWDAFSVYLKDKELLSKFRMISIDRPGFGYSQFGKAKNLSEQAAIILPLIKHLSNGKPIHIIGHSLGGPLIVKMVAENANIFSSMVLLAASVDPLEEPKEEWRGLAFNTPLQYLLPGAFRPSSNEIWMAKKELVPLAKQFDSITCNAFIVHGDKDDFVPVGNAAYAKRMLIHAKSVQTNIIPGGTHFIPWGSYYVIIKGILLKLNP